MNAVKGDEPHDRNPRNKMKPIKITEKNSAAISAALLEVNGKAATHTFTTAGEIRLAAKNAEAQLEKLGLSKNLRKGASVFVASGEKMPNAYKYKVKVTHAKLVRGATDWTLTELSTVDTWHGGGSMLTLTPAQDERIIAGIRNSYRISQ